MNSNIPPKFRPLILLIFVVASLEVTAQKVVDVTAGFDQHIFTYEEIEYLEDPAGNFTIGQVSTEFASNFTPNRTYKPENYNLHSAYWYRIRIRQTDHTSKRWVLEFFDQTIDRIDLFAPSDFGSQYTQNTLGDQFIFDERSVKHKNFIFNVPDKIGDYTYYFKVKSAQRADIIVVLRSMNWLFEYANDEYFFFGIFYGMILVFSFYNLLMYAAIREAHYLYYILYLLCIGLFEMSADGIAFQYLWPESPGWNQVAAGYLLYGGSTCALLFINSFLHLRENYRSLFNLIAGVFLIRTFLFILGISVIPAMFSYRIIDVLPFAAAFYAAIFSLSKSYRPARFVVVGYSFLFFGIISRLLLFVDIDWKPFGELSHYSMGFCFIMEMVFLSFAIGDKVRILRQEKEKVQEDLNKNLEVQVLEKTRDLLAQSRRIEQQNVLLLEANIRLEHQSDEIARMNLILSEDNLQLKENVAHVTEARILSKDVDFDEFSKQYPDDESCMKFLAELKWKNGYSCHRCNHHNYSAGRSPFSRRCSKCGYEESATANTLLQSTHLPINKAFYMIFLVYASKGSISSYKLSEILKIRQSTCWSYSAKIKKSLREKRKNGSLNESQGWNSLLLSEESLLRAENSK